LDWISDPQAWIALGTLTALEIVLGIDNIIFISILAGRLPVERQAQARTIGLSLALFGRVALLLSLSWIMRLTTPLFAVLGSEISGRDLILLLGGLFLLAKATHEIHSKLEGEEHNAEAGGGRASFRSVILQILVLDLVFSLDSVITAVGMADDIQVMVAAVVIAILIMMASAGAVSRFIEAHPTIKMLALSFLLMVGVALVAEGLEFHIPRGYIYFAMAFSVFVEMLNLRIRKVQHAPIKLKKPLPPGLATSRSQNETTNRSR
jgi:predicted tellurium resistance membrane protein TerC